MKNKLLLTLFLLTSFIFAQESDKKSFSFSLEQAIEHATKNNYSIQNANRDVDAAKKEKMGNYNNGITTN